jgi:putative flippase GtrA
MKLIIGNFDLQYKFIAQAIGIAAGMVVNFFMSKYVIFRKKDAV